MGCLLQLFPGPVQLSLSMQCCLRWPDDLNAEEEEEEDSNTKAKLHFGYPFLPHQYLHSANKQTNKQTNTKIDLIPLP